MAALALYNNRNTSQKCRAIQIDTGASAITNIPDPNAQPGSLNADDLFEWDGHKFRCNANQAPAHNDWIVAFNDQSNYCVNELDFRDNWQVDASTPIAGAIGSVTGDPAATGSGGTGTQE